MVLIETPPPRRRKAPNANDVSEQMKARFNDAEKRADFNRYIDYGDKVVSGEFTQWQLQCALHTLTEMNERWKDPINTIISEKDYDICNEACMYFTGGMLDIVNTFEDGTIRVDSAGYYVNIGA